MYPLAVFMWDVRVEGPVHVGPAVWVVERALSID